ncbi:MAG: hypothetical protein WA997_15325, partial [Anaerolineales bacterium]
WQVVDNDSIAALTAGYFLIGFAIGLPQWLILRRQLPKSWIWLLGSSIGVAAGFWIILVTDLISQSGISSYIVGVLVYSIVTGLVLSGLLAYQNHSQANLAAATKPHMQTTRFVSEAGSSLGSAGNDPQSFGDQLNSIFSK